MKAQRFILGMALLTVSLGAIGDDGTRPAHWAFQPLRDPPLPAVRQAEWCRTGVDRFILARLEARELLPAPAADRRTLIRRATFDLTGLPPSADQVEAFVSDPSPDPFPELVDRLLNSPRYGEQWGRHWLDVVRYADTAGETADYPVPTAWRYRNYVIDAFNADLPYDEFLREQVAGDILARRGPRERYAQRVTATGYLAISRRFGFDSENYHHLTIQDTIDTLGQSVLGLTLGCARCHAHKYDPVSTRDYYALYGIFESTRYAFPGSEQKQKHRALVPLIPPEESRSQWRQFEATVAALSGQLERQKQPVPRALLRSLDDLDGDFELQAPAAGGSKGVLVPPWLCEGPVAITADAQSPFKNLHPSGKVGASVPASTADYRISQALHPPLTRDRGGVAWVNLDFRVGTNEPASGGFHRFALGAGPAIPAVEFLLSADSISVRTGNRLELIRSLRPNEWHSLQLTLNPDTGTVSGAVGRPDDMVAIPARPLAPGWSGIIDFVVLDSVRSNDERLPAIAFDNFGWEDSPIAAVSTTAPAPASAAEETESAESAPRLKEKLEALLADGPFDLAYAVSEGTPHDARIQRRGEPDRPGEEVPRGFLEVLGGGSLANADAGSGRLELAEWLTGSSNPLTARVMVNRIWQYHFGQGLVTTANDFGTRGQPPTHPELLEHLATEFIRGGWSIKSLHRLIMTSAAYRQCSRSSGSVERDPARDAGDECPALSPNETTALKARPSPTAPAIAGQPTPDDFSPFPRRRLAAEETRDAILLVSGGLDSTPGTGHPFPAPTAWGYTQHGPFSAAYEHHRRSVYLMTQRLKRHPFLALFDGPDPNASTALRRTSTVPAQALFFLNDPFVHASAGRFATGVNAMGGDEPHKIVETYRLALGRSPTEAESAEAIAFLAAYRAELTSSGAEASEASTTALSALARVLFGGNEFLTID